MVSIDFHRKKLLKSMAIAYTVNWLQQISSFMLNRR